jgi:hypothetical protein
LQNSYFPKEGQHFFSFLRGLGYPFRGGVPSRTESGRRPRLPGWSFQQRIYGEALLYPNCPDKSGPAVSPTDTLRKESTLLSEREALRARGRQSLQKSLPSLFEVRKIVRFGKARRYLQIKDAVCNIFIGGEAGQGLLTVGQILSRVLWLGAKPNDRSVKG